jgi:OOP family OmpA-OmpF porin
MMHDCVRKLVQRIILIVVATAGCFGSARAQDWVLNSGASHFYMQTVKANSIFEVHQFSGLDGVVTPSGDASVKIDLTSVASGKDVRDVRMRFLLFETYKFPFAEITAKLDMASLQALQTTTRIAYPLKVRVALHGFSQDIETPVTITRLSDKSVSVASAKPIVVNADTFGLGPGIGKLSEAVNGTVIATGATLTFDLLFETGDKIPELRAANDESVKRKMESESGPISAEACETRLSVISTAGAIYFKTKSADLDNKSEPILQSVADIANRCPPSKSRLAATPIRMVGGKPINSCPNSGHARSSTSCRNTASPPRVSKPPATATRARSRRMIQKSTGPRTAASNFRC